MSTTKVIKRTPDLGLKIRLQPVAEAAPCDCAPGGSGCEVTDTLWAAIPVVYQFEDYGYIEGGVSYDTERQPLDPRNMMTAPNGEGEPEKVHYGVPLGPSVDDVIWTWSAAEASAAGVTVQQIGGAIEVAILSRFTDHSEDVRLPVLFTALCGTTEVGWLRLTVAWNAH